MKTLTTLTLALTFLATPLAAQGGPGGGLQAELTELVRQIRRNMLETEKSIDKVETEAASAGDQATREKLDELVEKLKGGGRQITGDIEELIKKIPRSGGGGGGGQSPSSQGDSQSKDQSGSRDRNQRENPGGQPQGGEQPEGQNQQGGAEGEGENPRDGRNQRGDRKPEDRREVVPAPDDAQRWGFLPEELRQRLLDRNFREFTPEYQRELKNYFRRTFSPRR